MYGFDHSHLALHGLQREKSGTQLLYVIIGTLNYKNQRMTQFIVVYEYLNIINNSQFLIIFYDNNCLKWSIAKFKYLKSYHFDNAFRK